MEKFICVGLVMICLLLRSEGAAGEMDKCKDLENCEDDEEIGPICGLDKIRICFKEFPSKCEMLKEGCSLQTEFLEYHPEYCELEAFRCNQNSENESNMAMEQEIPYGE